MKFVRYLVLAIVIEAIAVLILVLLVAMFGPSDPDAAPAFARRLGYWVGPTAGFVLCIGGGWLVARNLNSGQVTSGLILGATVAAIDVLLLVGGGAEFEPIFVFSNLGRLAAGSVGGWLAGRKRAVLLERGASEGQ